MAHRFPLSEAPDPSARRLVEDSLAAIMGRTPSFPLVSDDGESLTGPFAPLSYCPDVTRHILELGKIYNQPAFLSPRKRELAILGLLAVWETPYIMHNHRDIAIKIGLTGEQQDDLLAGKVPEGLSTAEEMVYRLACALAKLRGPLDNATWEEYSSRLEKAEIVAVVNVVGGYSWLGLLAQVSGA
ncbi:hypothetical protein GGR50DRAFT_173689 [Xylaria sp. CBS 124048]|nr:hypothetical protein GGR50DRAFT_173689 [Xylaria sp. CBS 124048]